MADSNDLPDEMMELGVEENTNETNWNHLPFEMKEMVVKEMDIETRTRLKMCSKADKYLVESTQMSFNRLIFWKKAENMIKNLELYGERASLDLKIYAKESIVYIIDRDSERDAKKIQCSSKEEADKLVKQMFESIVFNKMYRFNWVEAYIDHPDFCDNFEFMISTKRFDIDAPPSQVIQWLKNIAPGVEHIEVKTDAELKSVGNIAAVVNAQELEISCDNDINDDQLLNFNCTSLYIEGKSNITGKGINQLIKKAISNDYPRKSGMIIDVDPDFMLQYWNDIIDGLNIEGLNIEVTEPQRNLNGNVLMEYKGKIKMKGGKCMEVSLSGPVTREHNKHFIAKVL